MKLPLISPGVSPSTSTGTVPHLTMSALALAIMQLLGTCAHAQTATPSATKAKASPTESIVIVGQRASLRKALAAQEQADHIVSVISSDDIGQLPDKNAAEALARLPGIAVQRDQGEGRYIVVRGLGPDYNAVTINGAVVPSPEASRRAVALDVLPAGLIRTLEVSKTLTPERDANSLGGTVEVKTLSAFDLPGQTLHASTGLSFDENRGTTSPSFSALWAKRMLDDTFGIAAGLSLEKRKFASDNVETGGAWKDGRLSGFELRDYLPERERKALALNLDFHPSKSHHYYLRSFVSQFSDEEVRDRLSLSNFSKPIAEGEQTSARAERRLRARKYSQEIQSLVLGSEHQWDDWQLALALGSSSASEDTPESINDARFRGSSNFAGVGFTNSERPNLQGPSSISQAASYNLQGITLQARQSKDKEQHLRWDLSRKWQIGQFDNVLKFGSKWSRRDKQNDTEQWAYTSNKAGTANYWGAGPISMASFTQGKLDYPFANLGLGIDPNLIRARVAPLDLAAARLLTESALNDYQMSEDINAAYLQASSNFGKWQVLLGARYEHTAFAAQGSQVNAGKLSALQKNRDYANWLPSLHVRYDLDKQTSIRAAWTNSLVRANFSQLAPGVNLVSNTEAVIGNPDLQPLKAQNFDLGVEHMLGSDGAVSAYLFGKDIKNFTYTTDLAGTGAWANYTSAVSYANGERAKVQGIELSYSQALRHLPAPWNGLLVGANMSFTNSSATISRFDKASKSQLSRDIMMPGQAKQMANFMLGYEAGPKERLFSARLALNYKSAYLLEVGSDILNAAQDRYVAAQKQLDLSVAYQFHPKWQIVFEASNLNNEKYYVYQGSKPYNAQFEQYGRTFKINLKASLF